MKAFEQAGGKDRQKEVKDLTFEKRLEKLQLQGALLFAVASLWKMQPGRSEGSSKNPYSSYSGAELLLELTNLMRTAKEIEKGLAGEFPHLDAVKNDATMPTHAENAMAILRDFNALQDELYSRVPHMKNEQ